MLCLAASMSARGHVMKASVVLVRLRSMAVATVAKSSEASDATSLGLRKGASRSSREVAMKAKSTSGLECSLAEQCVNAPTIASGTRARRPATLKIWSPTIARFLPMSSSAAIVARRQHHRSCPRHGNHVKIQFQVAVQGAPSRSLAGIIVKRSAILEIVCPVTKPRRLTVAAAVRSSRSYALNRKSRRFVVTVPAKRR